MGLIGPLRYLDRNYSEQVKSEATVRKSDYKCLRSV